MVQVIHMVGVNHCQTLWNVKEVAVHPL